ncbi:transcriptional regulatory moc3 [Fusarium pseudocircinatum]|uniref:Transcriptional regulatory moc3 n=1 Tax=Fusarium pseudocircinatum TaxID=56676 RepID=A0A8H5KU00_9HYPO|nr:transcriptional regulatory moc3 [Fusarium pseudocircinatum]
MSRERPRILLRASHPRHRKGLPKARTGCMTCRIRKIKCDEARPDCQRCIGTGRKCDGYGDADSVTQQTLIIRERPPITRALNNDLGAELSLHAFDYYRGHVSHQVGDTVDSDFWGDLVLRLAPTDPAIRHAISTISLMYAEKTKGTKDHCPNYRPAIVEYNKAILAVRSWPLATESRVKPLLVCLLFVCIEFMLGHEHQNAAKMHILQGRRLLANIEDRKTPEMDIIRQYLAPIYLRLAYVGNDRVEVPRHLLQMTTAPLKFASLADARCVLYYLVDIGFTLIYEVKSYRSKGANEETLDTEEDTLQSRYKHLTRELANWRHAFQAYLAFSDLDESDTRTAKLLTQRHCLMIVFLDSMVSGSDYICDRNGLCDLSIATDCATFVVNYDMNIMQGPSFTFESEVVGPVYWIAAKCRQPTIRRRALELLYEREKTKRVESLTMIKHTIAMVTRVIEIEEEGLEMPRGTTPIQDSPNKYEIVSREESSEWAEGFLTDQKEQWPVLWDLGSHNSEVPTKLTGLTAAREQEELAEGLAKGWPRERLVWPYGITRERRVLSVVVKKHTADDLWLEYVREPLTAGGDYRVMKEHIRFT